MPQTPILWSFRRCPYAMRARLAILASGVQVDLREILLKEKPVAFRTTSPSATVPCLSTGGQVIDESRDIMLWALHQNDPHAWLAQRDAAIPLIETNDGPFKQALDHTKYAVRFPDRDAAKDRAQASSHLMPLNTRLAHHAHLMGAKETLADAAIRPFVRQFANTDRAWFDAQDWPHLIRWLTTFETSDSFKAIMAKQPLWTPGAPTIHFP